MPTYAIGDLQGCYDELRDLLDTINFDERKDRLWFTGDLVNRGPKSLECLRFVMALGDSAGTVLGNHDLHLLAVAHEVRGPHRKDTLDAIMDSADVAEMLQWIRTRPFILSDESLEFHMVHAGLFPQWDLEQARALAREVEAVLRGDRHDKFVQVMYGDEPGGWAETLRGFDRIRCLVNAFTRMRYLDTSGRMNFSEKGPPGSQAQGLTPWYRHPGRKTANERIIFGHWSTVTLGDERAFDRQNVYPLDTGCLWGGSLTALRLDDGKLFSVPSRQQKLAK